MNIRITLFTLAVTLTLSACQNTQQIDNSVGAQGHTAPTQHTIEANEAFKEIVKSLSPQDFEDAQRGFIAKPQRLNVLGPDNESIYDLNSYDFIKGEAPDSVNPSLWRQEILNSNAGLFKVSENIYQVRGFGVANMSLIKGDTGYIVVDPLGAKENAAVAIEFARQHLGDFKLSAIIFTHSHVDHFAGVLGLVSAEEAKQSQLPIIGPLGFIEASTKENIVAGPAMGRRTNFSYGKHLARSERGHVGLGLGKHNAMGSMGILPTTQTIDHTGQKLTLDGVEFIFQYTPESEAPAELTFYLPKFKAFCGAELVSRNMHNLYTLRGAKVRDALAWSGYIDDALQLFPKTQIYFASHHWPIWGNKRITKFLSQQRDTYKYIHDQTMRLANKGFTPREIAEQIELPEVLSKEASNRGYYGTLSHNSRAVYQAYFGWFDSNPANLNPYAPTPAGKRYVDAMGGAQQVLAHAQKAFDKGDYRWVAQLLNHLIFAQPDHNDARELLARAYDQLGYQSESGPWRDIYLTGALELRHGNESSNNNIKNAKDMLAHTPITSLFDALGVSLNGPRAEGVNLSVKVNFTDSNESYLLWVENSVLHHRVNQDREANAQLDITYPLFMKVILGEAKLKDFLFSDELNVEGSTIDLLRFFALLDPPSMNFAIVEP